MVKLESFSQNADDTSALSIVLLSASMLSLVITVMGIKLRWFRHRLTLEEAENQYEAPVLLRTTSVTEFRENCARGVYRQSIDAESLMFTEKPSTPSPNGKQKTKSSDRQSIFRLPFKSKLSFTKGTTRGDKPITTIQQASASSVFAPNRDQEVATLQKNENLMRKIHDSLRSKSSVSMPDLSNQKQASVQYRERSVDEEPRTPNPSPRESNANTSSDESDFKSYSMSQESSSKRVKFGEINEIVEEPVFKTTAIFVAQEENDFDQISPPQVTERKFSLTFDVQEGTLDILPPTPMKRKSRESYFEDSTESLNYEDALDEPIIVIEPPAVKPRTKRLQRSSNMSNLDEIVSMIQIENIDREVTESTLDHPSKEVFETENQTYSVEEPTDEDIPVETINRLNQISDFNAPVEVKTFEESFRKVVLSKRNTENESFHSSDEEQTITPPIEVQVVPKSILRSSEPSISQKTITFQNLPQSISYEKDFSSSDSDEDVWSRVDRHRLALNRNQPDTPPPLPKTPPPPLDDQEEEKRFSYA